MQNEFEKSKSYELKDEPKDYLTDFAKEKSDLVSPETMNAVPLEKIFIRRT